MHLEQTASSSGAGGTESASKNVTTVEDEVIICFG